MPKSRLGGAVDDQPALELAVGDRLAEVGARRAGGDVPVDVADVVARLVHAGLTGLGAVTRHETTMVAVQDAVEPARDVDLESTQHAGGRGATAVGVGASGAGVRAMAGRVTQTSGWRRPRGPRARGYQGSACGCWCAAHVSVPWLGVTRGAGTVESTRARICSDVDVLGERLVGQHEAVAQDLGGHVEDVLGHGVGAATQQGERPAGADEAEAGAGAGAELEVGAQMSARPNFSGVRVHSTRLTAYSSTERST